MIGYADPATNHNLGIHVFNHKKIFMHNTLITLPETLQAINYCGRDLINYFKDLAKEQYFIAVARSRENWSCPVYNRKMK